MSAPSSPREQLDAAKAVDTPVEVLRELAASAHEFVRAAVARHPAADDALLRALAPAALPSTRHVGIAEALASNPHTPPDLLDRLARLCAPELGKPREAPWAFGLGVSLCCHPRTPSETTHRLLAAPGAGRQFRKVVARESRRDDVRAFLANDPSNVVQRALVRGSA